MIPFYKLKMLIALILICCISTLLVQHDLKFAKSGHTQQDCDSSDTNGRASQTNNNSNGNTNNNSTLQVIGDNNKINLPNSSVSEHQKASFTKNTTLLFQTTDGTPTKNLALWVDNIRYTTDQNGIIVLNNKLSNNTKVFLEDERYIISDRSENNDFSAVNYTLSKVPCKIELEGISNDKIINSENSYFLFFKDENDRIIQDNSILDKIRFKVSQDSMLIGDNFIQKWTSPHFKVDFPGSVFGEIMITPTLFLNSDRSIEGQPLKFFVTKTCDINEIYYSTTLPTQSAKKKINGAAITLYPSAKAPFTVSIINNTKHKSSHYLSFDFILSGSKSFINVKISGIKIFFSLNELTCKIKPAILEYFLDFEKIHPLIPLKEKLTSSAKNSIKISTQIQDGHIAYTILPSFHGIDYPRRSFMLSHNNSFEEREYDIALEIGTNNTTNDHDSITISNIKAY